MKTILLSALLALTVCAEDGVEVTLPPEEKTLVELMQDIALEMSNMELALRDERTDVRVQMDGKEIEDGIDKLIKEWEENDKKRGPKKAEKPLPKSELTDHERFQQRLAQMGEIERSRWINLPHDEREDMLQLYLSEVPLRWKRRIEAYFVSVADEEAKREMPKVLPAKKKAPLIALPEQPKPVDPFCR